MATGGTGERGSPLMKKESFASQNLSIKYEGSFDGTMLG